MGGILYDKAGYLGVFGLGFAILAIDFIMRVLVIEKKVAKRYDAYESDHATTPDSGANREQDDQEGQQNGEEEPLLGKKENQEFKIRDDLPWICRKVPILPCLADPRLLTALLVAFVQATLLGNFDATVPIVGQELFNFSSLEAGILFCPLGAFDLFLGPIAGWVTDRYGTKITSVTGYTYLVPVLVLLRLPHAGGKDQMILYGALLALCGAGLAIIGAPSIVEAGAVVENYYKANPDFFGEDGPYAQLYGLNSMVFSLGLTVGPELAGELKQSIGYGNMNIVLAGLSLATAILCFVYMGGKPKMLRKA